MGAQKDRLDETVLLSTHKLHFCRPIRKYYHFYAESIDLIGAKDNT